MHWRRKWQPTPVFLPGECQGRGSLVGCRLHGVAQSPTWLKRLSSSSSMEMMLHKKQIIAILKFDFKMGHKTMETTHNINNPSGPGIANEYTVQWWFKKKPFAKEMRALKMRSVVASHWKLTMTTWEDHRSWFSYNYVRNCWKTQCLPLYGHVAFEANWKGEKAW